MHIAGFADVEPPTAGAASTSADQTNEPVPVSLRVSGSIQRAPIKPDPGDPIFATLLVEAWLAGLRRSAGQRGRRLT